MVTYYIWVIYEDGSIHESTIKNAHDLSMIPTNKGYEAIRIFYDDKIHSHVLYGNDRVYLEYNNTTGYIIKGQFDNNQTHTNLVILSGYNQETIQNSVAISSLSSKNIFIGTLLADSTYENMRQQCHNWKRRRRPSQ